MEKIQCEFLYMRVMGLSIKDIASQVAHYMFLTIFIILNQHHTNSFVVSSQI